MATTNVIASNDPKHDDLPVYGGKKVRDLTPHDFARFCIASGVEGVNHTNGFSQNKAMYAAHLESIGKKAADTAIADWLAKHPNGG